MAKVQQVRRMREETEIRLLEVVRQTQLFTGDRVIINARRNERGQMFYAVGIVNEFGEHCKFTFYGSVGQIEESIKNKLLRMVKKYQYDIVVDSSKPDGYRTDGEWDYPRTNTRCILNWFDNHV